MSRYLWAFFREKVRKIANQRTPVLRAEWPGFKGCACRLMISTSEEILNKYSRNTEGKWTRELKAVAQTPESLWNAEICSVFSYEQHGPPLGGKETDNGREDVGS